MPSEQKPVVKSAPEPQTMSFVGVLKPFDPSTDDVRIWIQAFRSFLVANGLDAAAKAERCRAVLLSTLGLTTVSTLMSLIAPEVPDDKTLDELLQILADHFQPTPKAIAERFRFMSRKQKDGESVAQFLAELRRLATTCKFERDLDMRLRDQFIFGLVNESTQKRLFTKADDVSLATVVAIAQAQEMSEESTSIIRGGGTASSKPHEELTLKVNQRVKKGSPRPQGSQQSSHQKPQKSKACPNCGRTDHMKPKDCPHKNVKCYQCGKTGHFAKLCRSKPSNTSYVEVSKVNSVQSSSRKKIFVEVEINGVPHKMEFDTGCERSLLSEEFWKLNLHRPPLKPSNVVFTTYTNQSFNSLGELPGVFKYKDQVAKHSIPIGPGISLFGRDLIRKFRLDWNEIRVQCNSVNELTLESLLSEYSDIFGEPQGKIKGFRATISLKDDATPKFLKARPIPYSLVTQVDRELDEMEQSGVIEKISHSDWASPLVVVPKPNGRVRITGDFKNTVNSQLNITQYPIANPEKLFMSVAGGHTFSKLDGSNAYHQIELDDSCKKFLVINTHKGLYRYNVLPQGVASSPAIFQEFADKLLHGIPMSGSYIDDVLCSAHSDQDHLRSLKTIFQRMREANYFLSKDKCQFLQPSVEFLGHVLSNRGIHTSPKKLEAIQAIQAPKDVSELRQFLGLVNFYGKFVKNFADICAPLYKLTQNDVQWQWSKQCRNAFEMVKSALCESPILVHFQLDRPIGISCDASSTGLGVVLFHRYDDNGMTTERAISYASRVMSSTEQRYSQIEKEGLAIRFGLEKFYKFLCGRKFTLITDHKPLLAIFGPKTGLRPYAAARLHRWSVYMSQFNYDIQYRKTNDHGNADALSRFPLHIKPGPENDSAEVHLIASERMDVLPVTAKSIRQVTKNDAVLSKIARFCQTGWPINLPKEDEVMRPFFLRREEISFEQGVLMWGLRVIIPTKLRKRILDSLHESHSGIVRMKSLARLHVWWPHIDEDIESIAKSCVDCCASRPSPPSAPLHPWQFPERPWQRLHIDLAGPLFNKMWLVVMDAHSKWPEIFDLQSSSTSATVIAKLREIITRFGIPEQIVSDNGRQFVSDEFHAFCKSNGIRHTTSSVYHPRSNGEAERLVQTFKKSMLMSVGDVNLRLQRFLFSYRLTPHATTGAAPCELLLGRRPRCLLDQTRPDVHSFVSKAQDNQVEGYNVRVRARQFMDGEDVWVKSHSKNEKKWSLGTIVRALGPVTYLVALNGKNIKRHVDDICHAQKFSFRADVEPSPEVEPSSPDQSQTADQTLPVPQANKSYMSSPESPEKPISRPRRNPKPVQRYGVAQK